MDQGQVWKKPITKIFSKIIFEIFLFFKETANTDIPRQAFLMTSGCTKRKNFSLERKRKNRGDYINRESRDD